MSQIDMSQGWINAVIPAVIGLGVTNSSYYWGGYNFNSSTTAIAAYAGLLCTGQGSSNTSTGQLRLMSGTMPGSPNIANVNAVSSQVLCTFNAGGGIATGDFVTSQVTVNPAILSTQYVAATGSGTATWFWIATIPNQSNGNYNPASTPLHQIIGTVGLSGSGADLIMANTTVAAGSTYRIINLQLQLPTTWNF